MEQGKELAALEARLCDLATRAERGELSISSFLSPREALIASRYLKRHGLPYRLFGGYEDAERVRVYFLPSYMDGDAPLSELLQVFGYESHIVTLRVTGSGYASLSHRDFLGSLLGLGLERSVIGDILVSDTAPIKAVIFCDATIAPFLLSEWKKVGNDTVRISEIEPTALELPARRFADVYDTIATPRLDSVVASLCRLSRDRAKTAVEGGLVELNFEIEERPDRTVEEGAILSVRGYGRFRILSVSEQTKKGRCRLMAQKYL